MKTRTTDDDFMRIFNASALYCILRILIRDLSTTKFYEFRIAKSSQLSRFKYKGYNIIFSHKIYIVRLDEKPFQDLYAVYGVYGTVGRTCAKRQRRISVDRKLRNLHKRRTTSVCYVEIQSVGFLYPRAEIVCRV